MTTNHLLSLAAATTPLTMEGLTKAGPNEPSVGIEQHAAAVARLAAEYRGLPEVRALFAGAALTPEAYLWLTTRMKLAAIILEFRKTMPGAQLEAENEEDVTFVTQHKDEIIRLGLGWPKVAMPPGQAAIQAGQLNTPSTGGGTRDGAKR